MPRLIWVFTGQACHFVGFDMLWLISDAKEFQCPICFLYSLPLLPTATKTKCTPLKTKKCVSKEKDVPFQSDNNTYPQHLNELNQYSKRQNKTICQRITQGSKNPLVYLYLRVPHAAGWFANVICNKHIWWCRTSDSFKDFSVLLHVIFLFHIICMTVISSCGSIKKQKHNQSDFFFYNVTWNVRHH